MRDTLFTSKNHFDEGMVVMGRVNCVMIAESTARRLTKVAGSQAAAEEFYRIADVCATAEARPLEHWQEHASLNPAVAPVTVTRFVERVPPAHRNPWFWSTVAIATATIARALFGF